jgi:hypothetical protein
MLQIDHVYEFFYASLFKDFTLYTLPSGVPITTHTPTKKDIHIFNYIIPTRKIFIWDQEPVQMEMCKQYLNIFEDVHPEKIASAFITSELSKESIDVGNSRNLKNLYYFFHGFAALDWYRGFYALNYNSVVLKSYKHDFISFNRIISDDRSYRVYFVSKLVEQKLLDFGLISFGVANDDNTVWQDVVNSNNRLSENARQHIRNYLVDIDKLVIDDVAVPGWASADILRSKYQFDIDCFWHIVTETVFYYDKLHLTEKIFKPIVMKQPFMLLAAPGNLAYLKRYGFKTFEGIIDESYDLIQDPDARVDAVVAQLAWYCSLSAEEKQQVIEAIAPIVEYNFHHFYGEFKHIITNELLDNCKLLFKEIGYDDSTVAYDDVYKVLTN